MKHEFEKVMDGIVEYINEELLSRMNDVQEFTARVIIGRVLNNQESLKDTLMDNPFLKTFGIVDSEGMVDVGSLACDIKRELVRREKLTITIPMFGKITFKPSDVDALYRTITNEELINYANN